jgi:hypothetical protein
MTSNITLPTRSEAEDVSEAQRLGLSTARPHPQFDSPEAQARHSALRGLSLPPHILARLMGLTESPCPVPGFNWLRASLQFSLVYVPAHI